MAFFVALDSDKVFEKAQFRVNSSKIYIDFSVIEILLLGDKIEKMRLRGKKEKIK